MPSFRFIIKISCVINHVCPGGKARLYGQLAVGGLEAGAQAVLVSSLRLNIFRYHCGATEYRTCEF